MTAFISTGAQRALNLAKIVKIGDPQRRKAMHGDYTVDEQPLDLDDGTTRWINVGDVERLLKRPSQLTPAEPGTKLIRLGSDEDGVWITRTPLIAWALCVDGEVRPVTPSGVDDGTSEPELGWWFEMSDGGFYAGAGHWDIGRAESEQELLEWARQYFTPAEAA